MAGRPTIYWQSMNGDDLPSEQDSYLWNKEPDSDNTTHVGTKFVGDADNASVGLDLGAMTNLQEGDEFPILISHTATEPVTNCQFYFVPSANDRGDETGFANEDESDGSKSGLQKDFEEIQAWGDGKLTADGDVLVDNDDYLYGMRVRFWHEVDPTYMATDQMDTLAYSKKLSNNGKFKDTTTDAGDSPSGEETWIEPYSDYVSNDCAALKLSLSIPDIEFAGLRNLGFIFRCTYVF